MTKETLAHAKIIVTSGERDWNKKEHSVIVCTHRSDTNTTLDTTIVFVAPIYACQETQFKTTLYSGAKIKTESFFNDKVFLAQHYIYTRSFVINNPQNNRALAKLTKYFRNLVQNLKNFQRSRYQIIDRS